MRGTIDLAAPSDLRRRLAVLALRFLESEDVLRVGVCADPACGCSSTATATAPDVVQLH
jgi:hypothetical protein